MKDRKKILFIADSPLFPSGVGTQAKMLIEGLLKTENYKFLCLGGAIQHSDYRIAKIEPEKWGDNWFVKPVNGFGDRNLIRQLLLSERPDAFFLFQDPRFFSWLWEMEDEIRSVCPIFYWHIWDNDPTPVYNKVVFDSVDYLAAISLKTFGILDDVGVSKDKFSYVPHSFNREIFRPLEEDENKVFKNTALGVLRDKKFLAFWNNRNARRKNTGDMLESFKLFMDKVGKENAGIVLHTAPKDPEGQDLFALIKHYDLEKNVIITGNNALEATELNKIYNAVDCTLNIAFAEGHGCSSGESLMAGTPVVSNMTGGLQFQIGDWWEGLPHFKDQKLMTETAKKLWNNKKANWWGVPCFPVSRSCVGNQQLPFIYEDRCSQEDVANGMFKLYEMGRTKRRELGLRASKWYDAKFNAEKTIESWDKIMLEGIEKYKISGVKSHRKKEI